MVQFGENEEKRIYTIPTFDFFLVDFLYFFSEGNHSGKWVVSRSQRDLGLMALILTS